MMLRRITPLLAIIGIIAAASSCKKITESQLINGLWRINYVYIDSSTTNYISTFPGYSQGAGCCSYKMDFQDNGGCTAYYIVNDSVKYVAPGSWRLLTYSQVYMKVDNFIDGTFDITRPTGKHWILNSDANHIKAYDNVNPQLDTTSTQIDMTKI
ncbi:MAG TPA: hypothetical protein VG603_00130 [Chitinophagales bacterium]|nr:hypothetical protein [Chitinophagales bacterium]